MSLIHEQLLLEGIQDIRIGGILVGVVVDRNGIATDILLILKISRLIQADT